MLSRIRSYFDRIFNIGIGTNMPFLETVKIRILNLQVFFAASLVFFFLCFSIVTLSPDSPILVLALLAAGIPMILHHYKKAYLARLYWLLLFPIVIFVITTLYGTTSGIEYVYINFLAIGLMLFNGRHARIFYILFIMVLAYSSMKIGRFVDSPMAEYVKEADSAIIFASIIIVMSISLIQLLSLMNYYVLELQKTNVELRHKTAALENYVYASSHNLKTPLRQITSFVDLLKTELNGETSQEVQDYMEYIKDGSITMYETIEDLMEKSEYEASDLDS